MRPLVTLFAALLLVASCSSSDDSATTAGATDTADGDAAAPADPSGGEELSEPVSGGNIWEVTATAPVDITDAVLAANEYNEPPPEGVVYAGTEMTMTLVSVADDISTTPGTDWTVHLEGPEDSYEFSTLGLPGCGVPANELDMFSELEPGASVSGTYCIPVPADQIGQVKVVLESVSGGRIAVSP